MDLTQFLFKPDTVLERVPTLWVDDPLTEDCRTEVKSLEQELEDAQSRLYANRANALLLIVQGMDTSGKDGLVRHVFRGINPVGLRATAFGPPSDEEKSHDFLWRFRRALPSPGQIGIFNRSYYEQIMYLKVHREFAEGTSPAQALPEILAFEQTLAGRHIAILKLLLHISPDEQYNRLLARAQNPDKQWKLQAADITDRALWDEHYRAFQEALEATSTDQADRFTVALEPALSHRFVAVAVVSGDLCRSIAGGIPLFQVFQRPVNRLVGVAQVASVGVVRLQGLSFGR